MNALIAKLADSYALYKTHKQFSKVDHFYYDKDEVLKMNSDFYKFHFEPDVSEIHFESFNKLDNYSSGKLSFISQVDNGESNKNAIFYFKKNEKLKENINVILIHGWRSQSINTLNKIFEDSFISKGYNIYSYILLFHIDRVTEDSLYSGELFLSGNVNRTLKTVQQAVNDIRALIGYIKSNNEGKVILIGLSLGGCITNLVCEVEKSIDVLVSIFYASDLALSVFDTIPGKYIRQDFIRNGFDKSMLWESWKVINPKLHKPLIPKENIFLISGKSDKFIMLNDADELWSKWDRPERLVYNCGHSGTRLCKARIRYDTMNFLMKRM